MDDQQRSMQAIDFVKRIKSLFIDRGCETRDGIIQCFPGRSFAFLSVITDPFLQIYQ